MSVTNADNSRWVYQYDALGQVVSGKKYWVDGTPVAGQQFEYGFDDIGNRSSTKAGGDQSGAGLRPASYAPNLLNQHVSRTVPGAVDILGSATNTATVTVNNQATYRKGDYFRNQLSVDNAATSVWLGVTNLAVLNDGTNPDIIATNIGNAFVPKTPETFGYDADGNATNDGRWTVTWDAENRLINMTSLSTGPSGSKLKLDFAYDFRGRRIEMKVYAWNLTTLNYQLSSIKRFVYDGWNLVAELNGTNGVIRSYLWGTDLSGGMEGAGGVGGLLAINAGTNGIHLAAYDGNGNLTGLVDATAGTDSAQYEYGPFGELIRATGPMAKANPFRFSTKYQDDESDFLYYGFRYYNPSTGRWLSRDPIQERGGRNLYGFVANNPIGFFDPLGLEVYFDWEKFQRDWGWCCRHQCPKDGISRVLDAEVKMLPAGMTPKVDEDTSQKLSKLDNFEDNLQRLEGILSGGLLGYAGAEAQVQMDMTGPIAEKFFKLLKEYKLNSQGVDLYTKLTYKTCNLKGCFGIAPFDFGPKRRKWTGNLTTSWRKCTIGIQSRWLGAYLSAEDAAANVPACLEAHKKEEYIITE